MVLESTSSEGRPAALVPENTQDKINSIPDKPPNLQMIYFKIKGKEK